MVAHLDLEYEPALDLRRGDFERDLERDLDFDFLTDLDLRFAHVPLDLRFAPAFFDPLLQLLDLIFAQSALEMDLDLERDLDFDLDLERDFDLDFFGIGAQ